MIEAKKAFIRFQILIYFSGQNEIMHYVAQTQNQGSEMHLILPVSVHPLLF